MSNDFLILIFHFLFLIFYSFIFIYLPGLTILQKQKTIKNPPFSLALVLGFSLFSLVSYLVRFFSLPFWLIEFILIFLVLTLKPKLEIDFNKKVSKHTILFIILATLVVTIQALVLIQSGLKTANGFSFVNLSFHDSTQHISIIKRLIAESSFQNPGFSGVRFTNYHYLIDLSLAVIGRFFPSQLFHLYYRFYPLGIGFVFYSTLFHFAKKITGAHTYAHLTTIFSIFAGNLSFYFQFFRGPEYSWGSNAFMINPIVDLLQNPASIFVLAQLIATTHLVHHYNQQLQTRPKTLFTSRRLNKLNDLFDLNHLFFLIPITFITGTMIGFKAWGGLLITAGLLVVSVFQIIKYKKISLLLASLISISISLLLFLPHYDPGNSASPVWQPGWTLRTMVNDADRWNYLQDIFLEDHYLLKNNIPRIILLYTKWTLIYIIGNYGFRLVGLITIVLWVRNFFAIKIDQLFILTMTVLSLFLPLFFNQGAMAYDIEQFSPYALLFASVYTFHTIIKTTKKFVSKSKSSQFILFIFFTLVILISSPSNLTSITARVRADSTQISNSELVAFSQASTLTSKDSIFLLYPSERNIATLEFAALTNRDTYFSGRTLSVITDQDYEKRIQILKDFFSRLSPAEQTEFAEKNHITHMFLYSSDAPKFEPNSGVLTQIFSNSSATIYQFNWINNKKANSPGSH